MSLFRALVIMLAFSVSMHAGNLLKNPGFEEGTKYWKISKGVIDNKTKLSGKNALYSNAGRGTAASQTIKIIKGRTYQFSAWIKVKNLNGNYRTRALGATIGAYAADKNGKAQRYGWFSNAGLRGTSDWYKIRSQTNKLTPHWRRPTDTDTLTVQLAVLSKKNDLSGEVWWDDVCLKAVSMTCHVLRPSYKLTVTDKAPELKLDFEVWPEDFKLKLSDTQIIVQIDDVKNKKNVYIKKLNLDKKTFIFSDKMSFLKNGNYKLTTIFKSLKDEKILWQEEFPLKRITSFKNYPVYIDERGVTFVKGKAFFPMGFYTSNSKRFAGNKRLQWQLDNYIKGSPFNTILTYDILSAKLMKEIELAGKKIILPLHYNFIANIYHPPYSHNKTDKDEIKFIKKIVNKWKEYPALLSWYTNDERGLYLLKNHFEHYKVLNKTDPNHLVFNVHNYTADFSELLNVTDVMGIDCYPVPCRPVSTVAKEVSAAMKAMKHSRPLWSVVQMSGLGILYKDNRMPEGRPPTEHEFRTMSWLSICNGANGLIYYCLHDFLRDEKYKLDEYWPKYCRVAKEILSFSDSFLLSERKADVELLETRGNRTAPLDIYWRSSIYKNHLYIFVVKGDLGEACSVNFIINEKIKNLQVMTLGKDKGFKIIKKQKFEKIKIRKPFTRELFRRLDVKVYKGELVK